MVTLQVLLYFLMIETLILSSKSDLGGYVVPNADNSKRVKVDWEVYLCTEPEALLLPVLDRDGNRQRWQALGTAKWTFTPQDAQYPPFSVYHPNRQVTTTHLYDTTIALLGIFSSPFRAYLSYKLFSEKPRVISGFASE
jgi:hypothetical protein